MVSLTRSRKAAPTTSGDPSGGKRGRGASEARTVTNPALVRLATWFPTIARSLRIRVERQSTGGLLPSVNLLPAPMVAELRRRRTSQGFSLAGVALIAALGAVWALQGSAISIASTNLESTNALVQSSLQQADQLSPVGDYFDTLQGRLDLGATAYMEQADYSALLEQVASAVPPGVTLTTITVEYVPTSVEEAPICGQESSPFENEGVRPLGCVTFSGVATSSDALAGFIRSLDTLPGLLVPFAAPSRDSTESQVPFSGTAGISPSANLSDSAGSLVDVTGVPGINPGTPASTPTTEEPTQ